jgi:hypothetical protein
MDHGPLAGGVRLAPADTVVALRTGCALPVPLDLEARGTEAIGDLGLPLVILVHWPNEVDLVALAALHDIACSRVPRVNEVLGR